LARRFSRFSGAVSQVSPFALFQPFSAYSDGLPGNLCLPVSGFSSLFIGEKRIIFKIIFNFLKKVLKYPEKNTDRAFFRGFSKKAQGFGERSR
jgi:hypothetical protein